MADRRQSDPFLDAFERLYGSGSSQDDPFMSAFRRIHGDAPADEPSPPRGAISNAARGVAAGLSKTGTSLAGVIGMIPGAGSIGDWARRTEIENQDFYDPQGTAGSVGEFVGRAAGEIGTAVIGGAGALKAATKLAAGTGRSAKIAKALEAGLSSESRLRRAGSNIALSAPIDVLQGAAQEDGMLLPGRVGSAVENVAFSGVGGALLPAARRAVPGAMADEPAQAQIRELLGDGSDASPMGPAIPTRGIPEPPPAPQMYGPAIPMGPAGSTGPQMPPMSQVRGLLTATSTETRPVMLPGGGGLPPMASTRREVFREPFLPQASRFAPGELDVPVGAEQIGRARRAQDALMEGQPDLSRFSGMDDAELKKVVDTFRGGKPLPSGLKRLPDEQIAAELELSRRQIGQQAADDAFGYDMVRLKDMAGGRAMGLAQAKKMYGGDIGELSMYKNFSEEFVGALQDAGYDINREFMKQYRAAVRTYNKGPSVASGKRYDALTAEATRRGLDVGDVLDEGVNSLRWAIGKRLDGRAVADVKVNADGTASVFLEGTPTAKGRAGKPEARTFAFDDEGYLIDPSTSLPVNFTLPNGNRAGFIRMQALTTLAGGGAGALAGAAGAEEGDRGTGAILGGLIGAGLGAGVGKAVSGGFGGGARAATEGTMSMPPIGDEAVKRRARAEEAITFPATPTPRSAEYQGIPEQEMRERLQRRIGDEGVVDEMLDKRRAGEVLQRQGRRSVADELAVADARMRDLAEPELMDPKRKLSGAEIVRLDQRAEGLIGVQKKLQQAMLDESIDSERKVLMQEYITDLDRQINNTVTRATRDASQAGRDFAVLRWAKKTSSNPFDWMRRVMAATGGELPPESWAKIQQALQANDFAKAQSEMGKLRKNGILDQGGELYQTGLLTAFMRPVRDVFGNMTNLGDKQAERAAAAFFDRILSARTGVRTASFSPLADARAMWKGLTRGGEAAKAIWKETGDPKLMEEVMKRYDFERQTLQSNPTLQAYTTFVRKTLGMSDALVRLAATDVALAEQARVFAGRTAKAGTQEYQALVQAYLKNPPPDMLGIAMSQADEVTWQNSTSLGDAANSIRNLKRPELRLLGKLTVPFVQTPSSMITQTWRGSPAGLLGAPSDVLQIARGIDVPTAQRKLVGRLAKTSVGSAWIALGYIAADNDRMTAWYPSDDRERRRWELEGRTESALKIGGTWVSLLGVLGPQAQLMALGAALRKMTTENPEWTVATAGGTMGVAMARSMLDSPMMQGASTLIDLGTTGASGNADAMGETLNNAAQTFLTGTVPQAVQQTARAFDMTDEGKVRVRQVREPGAPLTTARNALMQGVPGLRQMVPVRNTALGDERATSVGGLLGVVSPAKLSRETSDPMARELWETNAVIPRTSRRKGESLEGFREREAALAEAAKRAVRAVMEHEDYQALGEAPVSELRQSLAQMAASDPTAAEKLGRLESMSDDKVRARMRGIILERAITRARTMAGKRFPDSSNTRGARTLNSITR